ncbi:UbiA prenyltransferase family protein [Flavobacterium pallidum]|uniref:Prenyltransferase n=1 Tax=Flavobacterium pallidum TaxID=2172098 RepID=A0A2S1SGQ7_9FLAO|nr:hypothetical protein [Flavobacterium pallidum]AWI25594.1 hypothetical protein HYN49_06610 [Flavobacterium pallidum]
MGFLKKLFDFYLSASLHVALSSMALVLITRQMFGFEMASSVPLFVFFGTVAGYNFVKYDAIARTAKKEPVFRVKAIAFLSLASLLAAGYFFLQLQRTTQAACTFFAALTILYTLPFFPNRKNARNWAGVKIYIVSLCWAGVTVLMPVLDADASLHHFMEWDVYLKFVQRFVLVFVLVLIFEIIDLAKDDPHLHTVPQQIGVRRTKWLGFGLLIPFYLLELLQQRVDAGRLWINLAMVLILVLFLAFANEKKSRYYAAFWVEAIPILWWVLIFLFQF